MKLRGDRGDRVRLQTEIVKFIALPFPFSSKLNIWSFDVVVLQGQQRNLPKSVMRVESCSFAYLTYCFYVVPLPSPSQFPKERFEPGGCNQLFKLVAR